MCTTLNIYIFLAKWWLRTAEETYLLGNKMMLFGFPLKYYVRVTRVCSNCDKTTSQIQSKTEKKCTVIANLQSLHYRQQQGATASLLDGVIILPLSTGNHGSFPLLLTLEQL